MNSALTSRESGAWLFHVTLDGRGNGVAKGWPAEVVEERTRARRWEKAGVGEKSVWIRAESDIKYIRIFSRDSPRRDGRSESWISFWWVFPFRLLLHFNPPPKKTHSSIAAVEYQCKRSWLLCGFFTSAFCPSRDRRRVPRDTLSRTLSKNSSREWDGEGVVWLLRGCFDRGKNWDICLVRFLPHGGPLERRINRWKLVLKKGIFAHMPAASTFSS